MTRRIVPWQRGDQGGGIDSSGVLNVSTACFSEITTHTRWEVGFNRNGLQAALTNLTFSGNRAGQGAAQSPSVDVRLLGREKLHPVG